MAKSIYTPLKLTINSAALEFRVTGNKVRSALKARNIDGVDGKFSIYDVYSALSDSSGLRSKAADSRYQEQIDKAEASRLKLLEAKGELSKTADWREFILDAQTVLFQIVRHSKLSEQEKALMTRQIKDLSKGKDGQPTA
jgi:hypothetical protein